MKSTLRAFALLLSAALLAVALASCGQTPAAVSTFDQFAAHIKAGNFAAAHAMLDDNSKQAVSVDTLGKLCGKGGELEQVFAFGKVKNTSFEDGNQNVSKGELQIFDNKGNMQRRVGEWRAMKTDSGWVVIWSLRTSAAGAVESGTGGAPEDAAGQ